MATSSPLPLALILGASGTLGGAIARALAEQGYAMGLHYFRSQESALTLAAQIEQQGRPVFLVSADLREEEQIRLLFERVKSWGYPLQVLVYAAGMISRGTLLETSRETWEDVFSLNLRGAWLCARAAIPLMQTSGGVIINLTDCGAQRLWTTYAAYVLSKGALDHLTRLLAKTLAPAIRVNAVAPGMITPGVEMSSEEWDRLKQRLPLGQPVRPEAVAQAVLFLIANPQITGQTLYVDSGYHLL